MSRVRFPACKISRLYNVLMFRSEAANAVSGQNPVSKVIIIPRLKSRRFSTTVMADAKDDFYTKYKDAINRVP